MWCDNIRLLLDLFLDYFLNIMIKLNNKGEMWEMEKEYEYSMKVKDIKPFINYCKKTIIIW